MNTREFTGLSQFGKVPSQGDPGNLRHVSGERFQIDLSPLTQQRENSVLSLVFAHHRANEAIT